MEEKQTKDNFTTERHVINLIDAIFVEDKLQEGSLLETLIKVDGEKQPMKTETSKEKFINIVLSPRN